MSFKNYLFEQDSIQEKLITLGNKRPNFGQVVILCGGAGSGKGFVTSKLLGIEGKVLDVDEIKNKIISPETIKLNKKIKDIYGIDVTKLNLRVPEDVALLHKINDEMGIARKVQDTFLNQQKNKETLPNVIFDTTMKSLSKLEDLVDTVIQAGYEKENIHIIWVMNDINVAIKQNLARERVVPQDILIQTHELVSGTMGLLLKHQNIFKYIDGDVWIVFNKSYVDSTLEFSSNQFIQSELQAGSFTGAKDELEQKYKASFVDKALYFKVKEKNKKQMPFSEISSLYLDKIKEYVPKSTLKFWNI